MNKNIYVEYAQRARAIKINKIDYNLEQTRNIKVLFDDYKKYLVKYLKELKTKAYDIEGVRQNLKLDAQMIYRDLVNAGNNFDFYETYDAASSLHNAEAICKRNKNDFWASKYDDVDRKYKCYVRIDAGFGPGYGFENINTTLAHLAEVDKQNEEIRKKIEESETQIEKIKEEQAKLKKQRTLGVFVKKSAKERIRELDQCIRDAQPFIRWNKAQLTDDENCNYLADLKAAIDFYNSLSEQGKQKLNEMMLKCNKADGELQVKQLKMNQEINNIIIGNSPETFINFIKNSPKSAEYKQYIKDFSKYLSENKISLRLANGNYFDVFSFVDFGRYKKEAKYLLELIDLKKQKRQEKQEESDGGRLLGAWVHAPHKIEYIG